MNWHFALIGQPVKHSRSPLIHQQFAQQFGHELRFELIECGPDEVAATVADFFAGGGQGMNVTLPHKATVLGCCASLSEEAELAQAANTLVPTPDGLRGENTDGRGLVNDLQRLGVALRDRRVLVIGAGGAARGIIKPLLDQQPAELVWSNRNPLRLEGMDTLYRPHGRLRCSGNLTLKGDTFDVIIHASAAGHQGLVPLLPDGLFAPGAVAYDLSYGPAARPFLDWASRQGATACHEGLGMLVEQAALSFQHWTGQLPDTESAHHLLTQT